MFVERIIDNIIDNFLTSIKLLKANQNQNGKNKNLIL